MLTTKYITENTDDVIARKEKKHFDGKEIIAKVVSLDTLRKNKQTQLDEILAEVKD